MATVTILPSESPVHSIIYLPLICSQEFQLVVLPRRDVIILGYLALLQELRQRSHGLGPVRLRKVRDRVPIRDPVARAWREEHAVARRPQPLVGPTLQAVPDVDDDLVRVLGQYGQVPPRVGLVLDLEAADRVLEEQGDGAEVGVLRDAHGALAEGRDVGGRVVVDAQLRRVDAAEVLEEGRAEVHARLDGAEDVEVDLVAGVVEGLHEGPEAGQVLLVGPPVGVQVVLLGALIERFLSLVRVSGRFFQSVTRGADERTLISITSIASRVPFS